MRILLILLIATAAFGCRPRGSMVEAPMTELEPGVYRVDDGERLSGEKLWTGLDEFWAALEDARFVLVAESHENPRDHAVQLKVLSQLAERDRNLALGMEMFQRPFQEPLDRYVAGEIDESEMLARTEWEGRWGFGVQMYAPLWRLAASEQIPVLALNARRELTKRIAAVGLDGLTDAERADLPEIERGPDRYRDWMRDVFRAHGAAMDSKKFERFFQAQITWDETMADTAVRWANEHPGATVVIVVGRGHVERDFGIPSRIRRRIGAEYGDGAVVSIVPVDPEQVPRFRWMRKERFADYVVAAR
jgi:uncharacterized iron-regulated protein